METVITLVGLTIEGCALLSTTDTRDWRSLIFLAVLTFHTAIVLLIIRAARQQIYPPQSMNTPLILLLLPNQARAPSDSVTQPRRTDHLSPAASNAHTSQSPAPPNSPITVTPDEQLPPIDWEQEAKLAAQSDIASKQHAYRDLSALSPAQLSWVRQNHFEPAPPGIPWKYRTVEVTEGGFPIIHINDHCVAIPFLMMMVFCKIGHIEPKGELFEHMRDPRDERPVQPELPR